MHRVLPCMEEGIEYEWEAPMMFNESIYAMDTIFELFLFLIGAMLGICVVVIGIIYLFNRFVAFIIDDKVSRKESLQNAVAIFVCIVLAISLMVFIL